MIALGSSASVDVQRLWVRALEQRRESWQKATSWLEAHWNDAGMAPNCSYSDRLSGRATTMSCGGPRQTYKSLLKDLGADWIRLSQSQPSSEALKRWDDRLKTIVTNMEDTVGMARWDLARNFGLFAWETVRDVAQLPGEAVGGALDLVQWMRDNKTLVIAGGVSLGALALLVIARPYIELLKGE